MKRSRAKFRIGLRRGTRRAAIVSVVVGVVAAAIGTSALPAHALGSITVTPNTGLTQGSKVVVAGSGFTGNATIAALQCVATQALCDYSTLTTGTSDATGSYTLNVNVVAQISNGATVYDCAAFAGACILKSSELINPSPPQVPLTFVPSAPPTRGTIALSASSVFDSDNVTVTGSGWSPKALLRIGQCPSSVSASTCTNSFVIRNDAQGDFSQSITVRSSVLGVDCAASGACVIIVADARDLAATSVAAGLIVATPSTGTFTVTPSTGLRGNDTVQVDGAGWSPGRSLYMNECFNDCNVSAEFMGNALVGADGTFHQSAQVVRHTLGDPSICGDQGAACLFAVSDFNSANYVSVEVPISFTPMAPARAGSLIAPPSALLYSTPSLSGSGWVPDAPVVIALCPGTVPDDVLCYQEAVDANATGSFTYTFNSVYDNVNGTDCSVPATCSLVAYDQRDPTGSLVVHPFQVDIPQPGTLSIVPDQTLSDATVVTVTGHGWDLNYPVFLAECATGDSGCRLDAGGYFYADENGDFSAQLTLSDTVPSGLWFGDCAAAVNACEIRATQYLANRQISTSAPLNFVDAAVVVTSNYTNVESQGMQTAAAKLGVDVNEFQRLSVWATAYLLNIANAGSVTPPVNSGPNAVATTYPAWEARLLQSVAANHGETFAEFQKTSVLLVSYLLS